MADHPDGYSEEDLIIPGIEGCVDDPCLMGFRGADLDVVANTEFLENNPTAVGLQVPPGQRRANGHGVLVRALLELAGLDISVKVDKHPYLCGAAEVELLGHQLV